ncbi:hypothetical protein O1L60_29965 [Streptomyces diastatochromogenes]|nr:hypothetical protein [Streptomyces diastatochromogenes]
MRRLGHHLRRQRRVPLPGFPLTGRRPAPRRDRPRRGDRSPPHPEHTPTRRPVLGRLGGAPDWLQDDETPLCPVCARHMAFTAQLEEGHDYATAANFGGGGLGYVFSCQHCGEAAFLWQR